MARRGWSTTCFSRPVTGRTSISWPSSRRHCVRACASATGFRSSIAGWNPRSPASTSRVAWRTRATVRSSVSSRARTWPPVGLPPTRPGWTPVSKQVGAVVVGGDYQGLGIARSLGRRGIPVCVIDDERSIARYSRYTTHAVWVESLRDQDAVRAVLDIGDRLQLDGWVLYPTREETVAAFSGRRDELGTRFRVPTPAWETIRWAWDKHKTYELATQLSIPVPQT